MRTLSTIILAILFQSTIFGTVQIPDRILYNGKEYDLLRSFPMEYFFEKYPEKRPEWIISLLWRGYVAAFRVKNNQLYLRDIGVLVPNRGGFSLESIFDELFPNQESVKADWITDTLVLPDGKRTRNTRYDSRYEYYILLEIENGNLISEKRLNHREYRRFFRQKQRQKS